MRRIKATSLVASGTQRYLVPGIVFAIAALLQAPYLSASEGVNSNPASDQAAGGTPGQWEPGPGQLVEYVDPEYASRIRQLRKDDGHEHNLYYYRDPWNADGKWMLGVQSDLEQKNWHVCLYTGDGVFVRSLYPIQEYDWRVCWDSKNPDLFYTWKGSALYRFSVSQGRGELIKDFRPLTLMPSGPSCTPDGQRILVVTSDRKFRSLRLPNMDDERVFEVHVPEGASIPWDKPRYIGFGNYIDVPYRGVDPEKGGLLIYDDFGRLVSNLEGIGAGGHYDFSPDGKLAYFRLATGGRGRPETPFEIHVVQLDGTEDQVLWRIPRERVRFHNVHLAWPRGVTDWFVAGFFPAGGPDGARPELGSRENPPPGSAPSAADDSRIGSGKGRDGAHVQETQAETRRLAGGEVGIKSGPFDEIVLIRLDGTVQCVAHTATIYSRAGRRGQAGDMFWAQPLPRPSRDGTRICFNSIRSGTIDLYLIFLGQDIK